MNSEPAGCCRSFVCVCVSPHQTQLNPAKAPRQDRALIKSLSAGPASFTPSAHADELSHHFNLAASTSVTTGSLLAAARLAGAGAELSTGPRLGP